MQIKQNKIILVCRLKLKCVKKIGHKLRHLGIVQLSIKILFFLRIDLLWITNKLQWAAIAYYCIIVTKKLKNDNNIRAICVWNFRFYEIRKPVVKQAPVFFYSQVTNEIPSANPSLYPVMVYIHGGGYTVGSGQLWPGTLLAERKVVVVTMNYRLNALGELYVKVTRYNRLCVFLGHLFWYWWATGWMS